MLIRQLAVVTMGALMLLQVGCQGNGMKSSGKPAPQANEEPVEGLVIAERLSGDQSGITRPRFELITSQSRLDALQSEELSNLAVDFDKHSLVLKTLGQKPTAGYWVWIDSVSRKGSRLYVQTTVNAPGEGAMTAQVITTPYCAAVVPKLPGGLIEIEEPEEVTDQPSPAKVRIETPEPPAADDDDAPDIEAPPQPEEM